MTGAYRRLLAPGTLGPLRLRNRIVMPAMDQNLCSAEGLVTDDLVAHYEERAAGGVGLLILETSAVAYPVGATSRHQPSLATDECITGLRRLARAAHGHGAYMIVQVCHHGKVARVDARDGRDQLVPSLPVPAFPVDPADITPTELERLRAATGGRRPTQRTATPGDLEQVVRSFAAAALRVQEAGLDGVEIHAGHGYLISSFLSPLHNHRADSYGGSEQKRARLLIEVVAAVRAACGPGFAVVVRLDGREYVGGENPGDPGGQGTTGIDPALAGRYAARAEAAGADAVHVSASSSDPLGAGFTDGPLPWLPGQYLELARAVKARVSVPVIAVGRLSPPAAEEALGRGDTCDFVAMGRQLLADPDIPNRLSAGREDLIRTCINCFVCVAQNFWDGTPVCAVNTRLGHYSRPTPPARPSRRVVVIGGGPAGMEAARVAAGRGHRVVLFEQHRLGGTAWLSALTTPANGELVRYLERSLDHLGVEVHLGVKAGLPEVEATGADAVVVATGAARRRPDIPGGHLPHVLSGDDLRDLLTGVNGRPRVGAHQAMLLGAGRRLGLLDDPGRMRRLARLWMPVGRKVTVIGGGLVGVELAEFLAERGRDVTVIEDSRYIGAEMALPRRTRAVRQLAAAGVRTERCATTVRIDSGSVVFSRDGRLETVPADTVIYAAGVQPDRRLADVLAAAGFETHAAGDCAGVGYIQGAVHSGAAAAERI